MERIETIRFLYYKVGTEKLTELVHQGKITLEEFKEVTGLDCEVNLTKLKDVLREKVRAYKWIKSQEPFEYDGYLQENRERDKSMMKDCMDALQLNVVESIEWKLPDESRKTITDYNYFLQMRAKSTMIVQKCFSIEEIIVAEIEALTEETAKTYNVIERFNELFAAE